MGVGDMIAGSAVALFVASVEVTHGQTVKRGSLSDHLDKMATRFGAHMTCVCVLNRL